MSRYPKPKVGDVVFVRHAQYGGEPIPVSRTITKVGRLYFYVGIAGNPHWDDSKYTLDRWNSVSEYGGGHMAYPSEKAIEEEVEATRVLDGLRTALGSYGPSKLTLQQLQAIEAIIRAIKTNPATTTSNRGDHQ